MQLFGLSERLSERFASIASAWTDLRERARRRDGEDVEAVLREAVETLELIHAVPGVDPRGAMAKVAHVLASVMSAPLLVIMRRQFDGSELEPVGLGVHGKPWDSIEPSNLSQLAFRGESTIDHGDHTDGRILSMFDVFRQTDWMSESKIRKLRSFAFSFGRTADGGELMLAAYLRQGEDAYLGEMSHWSQRVSDELARLWDEQVRLEQDIKSSRQTPTHSNIHWDLLNQPSVEDLYQSLVRHIAGIFISSTADICTINSKNQQFCRVALAGAMAEDVRNIPFPGSDNFDTRTQAITEALANGAPVILPESAATPEEAEFKATEPLVGAEIVGCWPLFSRVPGERRPIDRPAALLTIASFEREIFDETSRRLLDEIICTASFAIGQHIQHRELLKEKERQTYLALHDAMTHLPNRRALEGHLESLQTHHRSSRRFVALGLLDLDDLKPINDRHGHAMGDRAIVEIATRLRRVLRSEDYVARLGGDEFVVVLYDLASESDLEPLLGRVWDELHRPIVIDNVILQLEASLGVAICPPRSKITGDQLLRRADQAMYQIKSRKHDRPQWWLVGSPDEHLRSAIAVTEDHASSPYGKQACHLLSGYSDELAHMIERQIDRFSIGSMNGKFIGSIFRDLPTEVLGHLNQRIRDHVLRLADPRLTSSEHEALAKISGLFYAANGIEEPVFLEASDALRDLIRSGMDDMAESAREQLANILLRRLDLDGRWQIESIRDLQRQRIATLATLNTLAWSTTSYMDLVQGVVDILISHQEIKACSVARPDPSGKLIFEAVAGEAFSAYFFALAKGEVPPASVDASQSYSDSPSARAWRTNAIHRSYYILEDLAVESWRSLMEEQGVNSIVAVPLDQIPGAPIAILSIYSSYVGGFQGKDQQVFIEQVQVILNQSLARLAPPRTNSDILPFFVRDAWRAMIETGVVEVHYQPLMRIADGLVAGFEALARLREHDGALVMPGRFLPALRESDHLLLFREALTQAIVCQKDMTDRGQVVEMSINVPAAALKDQRYANVASEVLTSMAHPTDHLLLEILESRVGGEHVDRHETAGMQALRTLGFRLVEDDLGAGYSSLIRLRQYSFDRMKIDCAIVQQISVDPVRTLCFVRQLIRLGHDLGLEVVVEGIETLGMLEAARLLGADLGQGYAIAHPVPSRDLGDWMSHFELLSNSMCPSTAVGALANFLLWEEKFCALPEVPVFWQRHARADAAICIRKFHGESGDLPQTCSEMLSAAEDGPYTSTYRRSRNEYVAKLVAGVMAQETDTVH